MALKGKEYLPLREGDRIVYFGTAVPRKGVVRWLGEIAGISNGTVAGIELDGPHGTSDGTWCKKPYFDCEPDHGLFVDINALLKEDDFGEFEEELEDDDDDDRYKKEDKKKSYDEDKKKSYDEDKKKSYDEDKKKSYDEDKKKSYDENKKKSYDGDKKKSYDEDYVIMDAPETQIHDLVKILELALKTGDEDCAAAYARKLAKRKTNCVITCEKTKPKPKSPARLIPEPPRFSKLQVKVEKTDGADEKFTIEFPESYTLKQLKEQVYRERGFDVACQVWFFNDEMMQESRDNTPVIKLKSNSPILFIREKAPGKGSKNSTDKKKNVLEWECEKCTLLNEPTQLKCAACDAIWREPVNGPAELKRKYRELIEKERSVQAAHRKDLEKKFKEYIELDDTQIIKNEDEFECLICFTNVEPGLGIILRDCLHSFCADCLTGTIQHVEDIPVKCPYHGEYMCESMIQEREIQQLLTPEDFQKYTDRLIAKAAGETKNSFYCKTPDCKGWCVYELGAVEFHCPICNKRSCISCQAIHEGENCKEYQDRLKLEAQNNVDAQKTQEAVQEMIKNNTAMVCPGCGVIIMKVAGCDWMVCSHCRLQICWATKGPRWGPKGQGDTSGGCHCNWAAGRRCHPKCGNCH